MERVIYTESFLKINPKAGEMTQWLRALAAFPEVLSSIPSKHGGSQPSIIGSDALLWHALMQIENHIHKNK